MARGKNNAKAHLQRADGLIPAALYLRVSSSGQDVENSIDAQQEYLHRWAKANGYVIVKTFTDEVKTGMISKREDFRDMIEVAESPDCPFAVVLVWRFNRFFRNREESAVYKSRLRKKGVRVVSINEKTDESATGQLIEGVIESIDEYTSKLTSEEVRRGTHNLARRGFYMPGRAPYGMMRVKVTDGAKERHKLAPDPKTRHTIRRIFDLALQEKTDNQIQRTLRSEGILNSSGKPWSSNRIHDVLTNCHYEGTIAWGRLPDGTPETVYEGAHDGIVTREEFAQVQKLRLERAPEVTHPRNSGSEHMLSGLGRCRQCGASYVYRPSGGKGELYEYIICKTRKDQGPEICDSPILPAAVFEAMTLDVVEEDILLRRNIESAIGQLREDSGSLHSDRNEHISRLGESVAELDRRIEKVYLAWENEDIPYELFRTRSEELRELKAEAVAELAKAEGDQDDTHVILDGPEEVLDYAGELKAFLRDSTPVRTRAWLKTFLVRYWVEPGCVTYEYRLPLPPGSVNAGLKRHGVPLGGNFSPTTRLGPQARG